MTRLAFFAKMDKVKIFRHHKNNDLYNVLGTARLLGEFKIPYHSGFSVTSALDATNTTCGREGVVVFKNGWGEGSGLHLYIRSQDNLFGLGEEFVIYRSLKTDKLWFRLKEEFETRFIEINLDDRKKYAD